MYSEYEDYFETRFLWEVAYSVISEQSIIRLKDDKGLYNHPDFRPYYKPYKYNVFSKENANICEEFASINTNDLQSIGNFVNTRGILGLRIEKEEDDLQKEIKEHEIIETRAIEENDLNIITEYRKNKKEIKVVKDLLIIETIEDFTREVKLMKAILILNKYEKIKVSEEQEVKNIIKEIEDLACIDFELKFPDDMLKTTSSFVLLQHKAKALISAVIGLKMKNVKPKLVLTYEKGSYNYINTWQPKSLLGCMYAMLYDDLFQGLRTTKCPVCLNPVIVRDSRSKQYHLACRGSKNTANTRKNLAKKAEKHIVEKYSERLDVTTDEILENEKDFIYSEIGKSTPFNKKRINEWLNRK